MNRNSNLIYFNNNHSTPLDETVRESMLNYLTNPLKEDKETEEKAKLHLCGLINAEPSEVVFTSGTTQSIYLAIKSIYELNKHKGNHIITNMSEHFAVLNCLKELETQGAEVTYLGVDKEGLIDLEELRRSIKSTTIMVSIMAANNETGVIQPVEDISAICQEKQIPFFSDASQFAGKLRCDVKDLGFDCIAFGAHKMYGPDGIGLLYVDKKHRALMDHLKKNYAGHLTLAQKVGFGKAAELSQTEYWDNSAHISRLKNYLEHQLLDLEGLRINGSTRHRLYSTSNLTFADKQKILPLLERFDFAENVTKPSYVLKAMGLTDEEIKNSFRFSFGKYNTLEEVKVLVEAIMH